MAAKKELYKRGEIWWYRFTNPQSGKQVRRSTHKAERGEAQQVLDAEKAKAWIAPTDKKEVVQRQWGEAAIRWLEEKSADGKRSLMTDACRLQILNEVMVNKLLTDISGEYVQEVIVKGLLKKRGVKPATVNRYVMLIQSILNLAYKEWRWINQVPYLPKPGKSQERKREAWVTPDQFKRILAELPEHTADMALFAVATGLRYSNVNDLEWREIDVARNCIVIPKEKFKTKRDHVLPINETARKILVKHLGKHPNRVFTYNGKPFERMNQRYWHKAVDRAGVNDELRAAGLLQLDERFVFHGLRHTFATWLMRIGVSAEVVEKLGGWASSDSRTVFTYAHIADISHLLPYSRRMDEILLGANKEISTVLAQDNWSNLAQLALTP